QQLLFLIAPIIALVYERAPAGTQLRAPRAIRREFRKPGGDAGRSLDVHRYGGATRQLQPERIVVHEDRQPGSHILEQLMRQFTELLRVGRRLIRPMCVCASRAGTSSWRTFSHSVTRSPAVARSSASYASVLNGPITHRCTFSAGSSWLTACTHSNKQR